MHFRRACLGYSKLQARNALWKRTLKRNAPRSKVDLEIQRNCEGDKVAFETVVWRSDRNWKLLQLKKRVYFCHNFCVTHYVNVTFQHAVRRRRQNWSAMIKWQLKQTISIPTRSQKITFTDIFLFSSSIFGFAAYSILFDFLYFLTLHKSSNGLYRRFRLAVVVCLMNEPILANGLAAP